MTEAFFITFREGLEAAVIVGILFSILRTFNQQKLNIMLWGGVVAGVIASGLFAWLFITLFSGFSGTQEKIYEGILMLGASVMISHMVFWMQSSGRKLHGEFKQKISDAMERKEIWIIAAIAFFSVVREGVETVIFFQAIDIQADGLLSLWGGSLGLITAIALATVIFWGVKVFNPIKFLKGSSYLLIFIAAGLFAHGIVELQGAGIIPIIQKPIVDLSGVLSESAGIGSFLKALFGYDANPSLIELVGYFAALATLLFYYRKNEKRA